MHVLTVSRLCQSDRYKNVDLLIKAVAALGRSDIELTIIGDGNDRQRLEDLACEVGLLWRVHFMGTVSEDVLQQHYKACDVFVLPSTLEGFGLVYLEAMKAGKSVIAANACAVTEVVINNVTGFLVEPDSLASLSAALAVLVSRPERVRQMGEAGKNRYQHEFSKERYRARLKEILG